jgi:hypothetical protein
MKRRNLTKRQTRSRPGKMKPEAGAEPGNGPDAVKHRSGQGNFLERAGSSSHRNTRKFNGGKDIRTTDRDGPETRENFHHSRSAAGAHRDCGHLFLFFRDHRMK